MIVICPACRRKYRLEDSLVKSPYQKMHCSGCGHTFVGQGEERKGGEVLPPDPAPEAPPRAKGTSAMTNNRALTLVVSVLVAFFLSVAGYVYWMNYLGAGNRWLKVRKVEGQETVVKDGRVFAINGIILNGSTKPRKFVLLTAKLFDEQGAFMGQGQAVAGVALRAADMAQMETSDIEERVVTDARKGDPANQLVYPRKEIPFCIVISGSYKGKPKEFTVQIANSPFL
jgi:hypothetical protein